MTAADTAFATSPLTRLGGGCVDSLGRFAPVLLKTSGIPTGDGLVCDFAFAGTYPTMLDGLGGGGTPGRNGLRPKSLDILKNVEDNQETAILCSRGWCKQTTMVVDQKRKCQPKILDPLSQTDSYSSKTPCYSYILTHLI